VSLTKKSGEPGPEKGAREAGLDSLTSTDLSECLDSLTSTDLSECAGAKAEEGAGGCLKPSRSISAFCTTTRLNEVDCCNVHGWFMVELLECASPGLGPGCLLWYIWVGVVLKCIAAKPGESEKPNWKSYMEHLGNTYLHLRRVPPTPFRPSQPVDPRFDIGHHHHAFC
jgi:hypothetical protein